MKQYKIFFDSFIFTNLKDKEDRTKYASKKNTIIIIDDSNQTRFSLKKSLRDFNYQVIACSDILNGVRTAQIRIPEIIFLDISDSEINGIEILKIIKKNSLLKNIPVILVIKDATKEKFHSILLAGAAGIIAKPVRKEAVAKIMEEILGDDFHKSIKRKHPSVLEKIM